MVLRSLIQNLLKPIFYHCWKENLFSLSFENQVLLKADFCFYAEIFSLQSRYRYQNPDHRVRVVIDLKEIRNQSCGVVPAGELKASYCQI